MQMNKTSNKNRGMTEINLTSLVDVCLTLVIIFMVSYPMVMQSAIKVSTPSLKKAKSVIEVSDMNAEIFIRENDEIELNGLVVDSHSFSDSLRTFLSLSREKLVLISAEENVMHDRVVAVLDEAKQCGAEKLSIVRKK